MDSSAFITICIPRVASQVVLVVKNPHANAGAEDAGSIPGSGGSPGGSPGGGRGHSLQYSGLENPHGQRSLVDYRPWGRTVRLD